MKKFRVILISLLMLLLAGTVSAASKPLPYAIKVNRACNTVTVYTPDESGQYTVPYKAMICSTARKPYVTPLGEFKLTSYRVPWQKMVDGTYGQYSTQFKGNYLFHSICYSDDSHDAMVRDSYNKLGTAASMGCIRLETADAKWIYDNCPAGTSVTIYEDPDSPGPLGKPDKTVYFISEDRYNGWDPTDPAENNPWNNARITSIVLSETTGTLQGGEAFQLSQTHEPEEVPVFWKSSNEAVATVDENGRIIALSSGITTITTGSLAGETATCTITVKSNLLPFDDIVPGAWYYNEVRKATEMKLFQGQGNRIFAPDATMTRAMVVQVLHQMAGKPRISAKAPFTDVTEGAWYTDAVKWAAARNMVKDITSDSFFPDQAMTRQEMAVVLWRYAGSPKKSIDLSAFSDTNDIADYAVDAIKWAVSKGILQGSNGNLQPEKAVSRVEAAAIFLRYKK